MAKKIEFIDLGLPSGRLWTTENEEGYYAYDEAKEKFEELLPKPDAFVELWEECQWLWDVKNKGMIVVGPNKNTIFLPASGCQDYNSGINSLNGSRGYYWSQSLYNIDFAIDLYFCSSGVSPDYVYNRELGFSVRLCKEQ